jgi:hypothetical protein
MQIGRADADLRRDDAEFALIGKSALAVILGGGLLRRKLDRLTAGSSFHRPGELYFTS